MGTRRHCAWRRGSASKACSLATGGSIADVAPTWQALGIMSAAELNALLVPERLTQPVRLVA